MLDRNNEPSSTVYYLAAVVYDYLSKHDSLDATSLYSVITSEVVRKRVNYTFYLMALDFLFLLEKIDVNRQGDIYVH